MLQRYPLIVFDWDGTLFDSAGNIVRSLQAAVAELGGTPPSDETARHVIGLDLQQALQLAAPDVPAYRHPLLAQAYRAQYRKHQGDITLFTGAHDMLLSLKGKGHMLAVATGKSRTGLNEALDAVGLSHMFDATRTADQTAGKPHPLMLQEILGHCRVAPEQALMVGDSVFDLQMASNAGVDSVAVGFGAQSLDTLRAHGPRLAINEFSELRAWLGVHTHEKTLGVGEYVG